MTWLPAVASAVGSLAGVLASNKLMQYRIQQLESKVNKHNSIVERTYKLEGEVKELQHDVRLKRRYQGMRINWLVRFRNKTFLASFLALVIAFVYNLLALFGVTPTVQQDALLTAVNAILTVLGMIGVIADPTTKGISDSAHAMTYDKPKEG